MVSFLSIFLGLVIGAQTVELAVSGPVEWVELRLDGLPVATLDGPPWSAAVDFGDRPRPGRLEAIAYDHEDAELGRATQWVNVPRPAAAVEIAVETAADGGAAEAVLTWESLAGAEPIAATVTFDGEPLDSSDPRRWELPPHDPEALHLIRAELDFQGSVTASAERLWGGAFRDAFVSVATAVIVEGGAARDADRLEALDARFLHEGLEVRPVAVERGPLDLVFVVARAALPILGTMGRRARSPSIAVRPSRGLPNQLAAPGLRGDRDWRAELLWPVPERRQGARTSYDLFPHSQRFTPEDGELHRILTVAQPIESGGAERLADAVAVAGLTAAANDRRRAVVLLVARDEAPASSASDLEPAAAAAFLADLQVPLEVWALSGDRGSGGGSSGGTYGAWGEAVEVRNFGQLERATRRLLKRLATQRVVWLEGAYLPRTIRAAGGDAAGGGLDRRAGWTIESSGEWVTVDAGSELLARPARDAVVVHRLEAPTEIELIERRDGWARARVAGWWGWLATDPEAPDLEVEPLPNPYAARIDAARRERLRDRVAGMAARSIGPYPLWTDVDNEVLVEHLDAVARSLETAYAERLGIAPGPTSGALVILFDRREDYRDLARQELGAGNFEARGQSSFRLEGAACCATLGAATWVGRADRSEVRQIVVHELVHLLNRRTFGRRLPLWLEEGLAEDLAFAAVAVDGAVVPDRLGGEAGAVLTAGRTGTLRMTGGRASLRALLDAWHGPRRPSLERLLTLGWRDLTDPEAVDLAYTASGLLVRFLLDDPERAPSFRRFLAAVEDGDGPADGARLLAELGVDAGRLENELYGYLRRLAVASDVPVPP